ncbi:MAG: asparaginase [Betaproteobacteria bacterium]|nr:asparaginase [Betaproteobacteria bacterium]
MTNRIGIALIGTGGTIAGSATSRTSSTHYTPASVGVEAIVASIPELLERYHLKTTQAFQLGSYDLTPAHWLGLLHHVEQALADPDICAAVITHGTDTLEETATFLHLAVQSHKPVIVIGAMRPATAYSADGPANVINACTVGAHPGAKGRGTMVLMKGEVADGTVRWFRPAHRIKPLALPEGCELPRVDLISAYAGADDVAIKAFIGAGARAIIHAGLGNGNAPPGARETLKRLGEHHVWLGRCSRWIPGSITRNSGMFNDDELGIITATGLQAHKLRIAIMIAIASGLDRSACQCWIDSFWG